LNKVCLCVCVCVCIYISIYTHTHTHTHIHIYIRTYIHTHTRLCSQVDTYKYFWATCCLCDQCRRVSYHGRKVLTSGKRVSLYFFWFVHGLHLSVPSPCICNTFSALGLIFYSEDGESRFLQNVGIYLPEYMATLCGRFKFCLHMEFY
jgi:hypothetical protein